MPTRTPGGCNLKTPVIGGRPVPARLLHPTRPPAHVPNDCVGKRIVDLFALHPKLASKYSNVDVNKMDDHAKWGMLNRLKTDLNIRPIRTRTLEFVSD